MVKFTAVRNCNIMSDLHLLGPKINPLNDQFFHSVESTDYKNEYI